MYLTINQCHLPSGPGVIKKFVLKSDKHEIVGILIFISKINGLIDDSNLKVPLILAFVIINEYF